MPAPAAIDASYPYPSATPPLGRKGSIGIGIGLVLAALVIFWLGRCTDIDLRLAATLALGFGFLVGWMQQMRGAHFLTHTLWSMWIACAIAFALTLLLQPSK